MMRILDMKDPVTLSRIVEIQQRAYRIEAEIIGCDQLPPLNDTEDSLKCSPETFIGYYEQEVLVGVLSYQQKGQLVDICRLAIHPAYFRRGIASRLLSHALELDGAAIWEVQTGQANRPAINCYLKHGFTIVESFATPEGIQLVKLRK
ncbi:GNAT family N-acetyltransferase [Laceyella sacchari]|jgi:ribosomal protein S18 acetylase RimI-like enzyme|nr:GNAT family N-acetyltransferase [Laceyella sacchari]